MSDRLDDNTIEAIRDAIFAALNDHNDAEYVYVDPIVIIDGDTVTVNVCEPRTDAPCT